MPSAFISLIQRSHRNNSNQFRPQLAFATRHTLSSLSTRNNEKRAVFIGFVTCDTADNRPTVTIVCSCGLIFQFFNLLPTLSCVENVSMPLALLRGWPRKKRRRSARRSCLT